MSKPGAFQPGHDPRRNQKGRGPAARTTIATLAKDDREGTFNALVRLRDQAEDERVQLEAAKTLAAYSDGRPSDAPPIQPDAEEEKKTDDVKELAALFALPPPPKEGT